MEKINADETSDSDYGRNDAYVPIITAPAPSPSYRVYHWRWLLLVALCVLSVSNGMMWLTFSPVPTLSASFYHITVGDVDWFSNSYFAASLLVGFFSIWVLDTFQLRVAIISGAVLNLIGAIIRYISTLTAINCSPDQPKAGFAVAMVGQIITACAQPFFLYAPTKLANTWFKPDERSICTGITSLANPLGIAIVQVVAPQVVKTTADLSTLLWILIIPAGVGALLSLLYCWSKPAIPPASSGDIQQEPFVKGVLKTLKNINFLVLLSVWGLAAGSVNAFLIIIPQYLCPFGYSNQEVGVWAALLIALGLVGAVVAGFIMDKTKLFKEVGVVAYTMAIFSLIAFVNLAGYIDIPVPIAVSLCLFGLFALVMIPVCLELGVEVTFPVAEATSSGLMWSVAQVMGMVILLVSSLLLATDMHPINRYNRCGAEQAPSNTTCSGPEFSEQSQSTVGPQDWTYAGIFLIVVVLLGYLLFVWAFRARLKRTDYERKKDEEKKQHESGS